MMEDQDGEPVGCDNMETDTGQNKEDISENIVDEYTTLEESALAGKCHYKEYEKLIDYLREKGDINKLRKIWDNFATSYPLPVDKWMKWIEDEEKFDPSRKQVFIDLFERALRDYISFEIWLSYQNLCVDSNILDVNGVRAVMERAVTSVGLHVSMGSLSWRVYREFELKILKSLKKECGPADTEITEQIRRIAGLYSRQLAIPAVGLQETYEEFQKWISDEKIDDRRIVDCTLVKELYEAALEKLDDIMCFEEALSLLEPENNLETYNNYIEHEKQSKWNGENVSRISCLYERAINDHRTVRYLWSDYIDYLIYTVKIPEDVLRVCERAVRNCTNSNQLWIEYLYAMERYNKRKDDIVQLLEKSLSQKFPSPSEYRNLWLSYLYYLRRRLDKLNAIEEEEEWNSQVEEIRLTIDKACEHLASNFGWNGDPSCELLVWGTRFEAEITRDMEIVRKTWSDILTAIPKKNSSEYWKKYLNMEWQYGDKKHMRKLCARALTISDIPNEIAGIWIEYESLCGSLDSMQNCKKKIAARLKEFKIEQNNRKNEREKKMAKKEKVISPSKNEIVKKDKGKEKKSKESDENTKKELKNSGDTAAAQGTVMEHDGSKDDRTIFISNLDYTVGEDELALAFQSIGNIVETRLVKDFRGRSKGYCYMVFSSTKSAEEALKMDRTPIDKRPMFISRCDPDKQTRKTGLRFNTGLEKNKLFVKGLPTSYEKKDVEELFKPFGQLKDVRLVTFRNGHSKGLAYVEYKDEVSAAHALLKTDGFMINDKPIKVVISDPPQKVDQLSLIPDSKTLGAGKITHGVRGRGRTELSFVPRSVQITSEKSNKLEEKMEVDSNSSKNEIEDEHKLTNTDFRKMLLGDKK